MPAAQIILGLKGHVVSVDATSGRELWRTKLKSSQFVTVYQRRERVFASASGELFCLDATNGSILWHNKLPRLGFGMVCFGADRGRSERDLIIGIKGRVVSVDPWNGNENWRSDALGSGGQAVTLLMMGSKLIVAGHYGELYGVSRNGGSTLWNTRLKGLGYGLVALGGNDIAVANAVAQAQAAAAASG